MPTKERWAKMSEEEKEKEKARHKKWVENNREKARAIQNKSYLKKVGGTLTRLSSLVDEDTKKEHRKELKRQSVKEWRNKHPEKIAEMYLKEKVSGKSAARSAKRRASKLQATPKWADLEDIKNVYLEAQYMGLHVDHIIPLQGKNVCGLHVWDNLQLIPALDNLKKGNRYAIHEES